MEYQIKVSLEKDKDFASFLQRKIREFNDEHSLYHREVRKEGAVQPINLIVSDDAGNLIGGLHAEVYWGWMEINYFWIQEEYRGKGLGGQLMEQAEKLAKTMGAKKALLTTFDFQARSYYEKKGYQIAGEIKDYPPGSSYYTMVKTL